MERERLNGVPHELKKDRVERGDDLGVPHELKKDRVERGDDLDVPHELKKFVWNAVMT